MSGRKQHFIPQVLLRQFSVSEVRKSKSTRVWVYPSGREPYLTATEGVAAQRHFYSDVRDDGVETLDDLITRYESRFSSLLRSISEIPAGETVNPDHAAEVVSHLVIRNAHLRDGVQTLMEGIADIAVDTFGDNDKLARFLGVDALLPGSTFDKFFKDRLGDLPPGIPLTLPKGLVRLMAFALARENIGQLASSQFEMLSQVLASFSNNSSDKIRDLHNETLGRSELEIPHGFITSSPIEEWKIVEPSEFAILPDCVAIGIKRDGEVGPLLFSDGKELQCVILPLSADRLLVGRSNTSTLQIEGVFNELAAESSDKFFISSISSDRMNVLQTKMGAASSKMFDDLLKQASEVLDPGPSEDIRPTYDFNAREGGLGVSPKLTSYAVSFLDFVLDFPVQEVANEINAVIAELRDVVSLDRLAGFTFAHDYEQALADLDRGFEATGVLSTISPEFGRGLFRTPLVVRDGCPKFQVIARAEMACGLIDSDRSTQEFYCYGLVRALGNIGYSGLLEDSWPGILLGRFGDEMDGERFNAVDSAFMSYFSCRLAAPAYPAIISDQIQLLIDTAQASSANIRNIVESHWRSPNFDSVGRGAMQHASLLLDRFAEVAGTLAGISKSYEEFSALSKFLHAANLGNWFAVFCKDLGGRWEAQGQWKGPEDFASHVIHFDRITWALSLPFWKDHKLGWQVFVPNPPEG